MLQGKKRDISLGVGLTSLLVTQTIYPAVLVGGFFFLSRGWLNHWQYTSQSNLNSFVDVFVTPIIDLLKSYLPTGILFPIGFLLMVGSLWLFDRAIPQLNLQKTDLGMINHLLYRPTVTFLLGAAITSLTMSVSVSLSLLVPLSVRGFVRRENIIPYIMGANITTFVDTLVAAALLSNPDGVTVVLVQMISVSIVCLVILFTSYRFYVRTIERIVRFIGKNRLHLFIYLLLIFGVPFILLWIG
jgi:solute carrier family 34 (sodium-dependent phosphate cotransporter)